MPTENIEQTTEKLSFAQRQSQLKPEEKAFDSEHFLKSVKKFVVRNNLELRHEKNTPKETKKEGWDELWKSDGEYAVYSGDEKLYRIEFKTKGEHKYGYGGFETHSTILSRFNKEKPKQEEIVFESSCLGYWSTYGDDSETYCQPTQIRTELKIEDLLGKSILEDLKKSYFNYFLFRESFRIQNENKIDHLLEPQKLLNIIKGVAKRKSLEVKLNNTIPSSQEPVDSKITHRISEQIYDVYPEQKLLIQSENKTLYRFIQRDEYKHNYGDGGESTSKSTLVSTVENDILLECKKSLAWDTSMTDDDDYTKGKPKESMTIFSSDEFANEIFAEIAKIKNLPEWYL